MQPVFDRSTPVVDFGATSRPLQWGPRKWMLWPALAYKVLIPARRSAAFNLFQRAMLDMCRAGVRAPDDIASRLALPPDLVAFVLEQLSAIDMLNEGGSPTARALRLLADEGDPPDAEDAGYVLVDGHSRRLWPRLHRGSLPVVDAEVEPGKPARFQRGTQGNPETVVASVLWPVNSGGVEAPPSAFEILRAARHHRRRVRSFARESSRADDADGGLEASSLKRVRLVGTVPEPVLVAACVFLPTDARHHSWLVTDPCGLGVSDVLRPGVARLAKEGKHNVRETIDALTGQAWHVDEGDLAHYLAEAHRLASARVANQLGAAASLLPADVVQRLVDADERLEAARARSGASTKLVEDFLSNAYAALEGVFGWVLSLYPDPSLISALAASGTANGRLLQRVASALGFTASDSTLIVLSASRGVVKGALCNGNKTLPGRLAAGLLAAQSHADHPLRSLAMRDPSALEFLAHLGKLRIDASHNTASAPTVNVAAAARDRLFDVLRALVGDGPALDVASAPGDALEWGADLSLRMRARAEKAALEYQGIEEFPELRTRIIDMHHAALLVQLLSRSGSVSPDSMRTRLRDFTVAASIAMEAALAEVERLSPSLGEVAAAISDDRNANAAVLTTAASAIGLHLSDDGTLPAVLTHARADRIRRAAHGEAETLSARLVAQVLSAVRQAEHPLREVARLEPAFLLHAARVVAARGHGDEVSIDAAAAGEIENTLREDLRALLAALD